MKQCLRTDWSDMDMKMIYIHLHIYKLGHRQIESRDRCQRCKFSIASEIARFVRLTWYTSGADKTQVDPVLAPWTLLSGLWFMKNLSICPWNTQHWKRLAGSRNIQVKRDDLLFWSNNACRTSNKGDIYRIPVLHFSTHDDVIKWKHIPRYWPFVWGIHRSPVNSPHKGQYRGALMFSLICA